MKEFEKLSKPRGVAWLLDQVTMASRIHQGPLNGLTAEPPVPEEWVTRRAIGEAVLIRAFEDLIDPTYAKSHYEADKLRVRAQEFLLAPNADLHFWCEVAAIDVGAVMRHAYRLAARGKQ